MVLKDLANQFGSAVIFSTRNFIQIISSPSLWEAGEKCNLVVSGDAHKSFILSRSWRLHHNATAAYTGIADTSRLYRACEKIFLEFSDCIRAIPRKSKNVLEGLRLFGVN